MPRSYLQYIAVKHGLAVYGLPEGCELRHPSRIRKLGELQKLYSAWQSGEIGFRKMGSEEWAEARVKWEAARVDDLSAGARVRGPSASRGRRQNVRKVGTLGLKAKGLIRSPEFVTDSDVDEE